MGRYWVHLCGSIDEWGELGDDGFGAFGRCGKGFDTGATRIEEEEELDEATEGKGEEGGVETSRGGFVFGHHAFKCYDVVAVLISAGEAFVQFDGRLPRWSVPPSFSPGSK